jgi:arylsulfatase A-like enzyme
MTALTRRRFLEWSAGLGATLAGACGGSEPVGDGPPSFVLLMGDDHGWDEVGYNGHPHLRTPVLDEMAARGLRLDRFYSASPVCSPTRGSVVTGRNPNRYGTFSANWSMRPEEITIAHVLADAGYLCGHFGKWHLGAVKAESPLNPAAMGFHEYVSHDNFFEMSPQLSRNGGPPEVFPGEGSKVVIEETIKFIDKARASGRPFLAVVWFGSPHEPYSGLPEDLALYDDLPAAYAERMVRLTSNETGATVERPQREVLRERYAEITAMDRAIGELRDHLEAQGLRDNTIVWYCGDNGVPLEGRAVTPFREQKGSVYEGGVRVPAVIEWPKGIPQPRSSDVNTVTSDILPTLCDLAGAPLPPRPLDGISLKPVMDGSMTERPAPIAFWNYPANHDVRLGYEPYIDPALQEGTTPLVKAMDGRFTRSFRNLRHPTIAEEDFQGERSMLDNRYKLVIDGENGSGKELFDVREDQAEQRNLIDQHPEIAAELERKLRAWQQSVLESLTGADYS